MEMKSRMQNVHGCKETHEPEKLWIMRSGLLLGLVLPVYTC
jgi:hypothetical protein